MEKVVAGTTTYLTVDFKDKTGAAATPSTVTYKVDNITTNANIRDWTSVSASSSVEITLTADVDNASPGTNYTSDVRRVTVKGVYSGSAQVISFYDYIVENPDYV